MFLLKQCRRDISPRYNFFPVMKDLLLLFSNPVGQIVSHFCAIIAVKRIPEPEVSGIVPKADQNIAVEIFRHIVPTNFKIAVQENAVLNFTQFVKILDNLNSFVMSSHHQIVLICLILCFAVKFFPFLNLTMQRWGNKKPCATFGCTGYKINFNYLINSDINFIWGIYWGKIAGLFGECRLLFY